MPTPNPALAREILAIRKVVRNLSRAFARIDSVLASAGRADRLAPADGRRPRRKPTLTPAHRRTLELQGRYMGTMRTLPAAKKAMVKKVRAKRGIRAAIAAARRLAG